MLHPSLNHPGLTKRQSGITTRQVLGLQDVQTRHLQLQNDTLGEDAVEETTATQSHIPYLANLRLGNGVNGNSCFT